MTITSFHPPQRVLMGPGPSDVSPRVLEAMARPTIGHLDPVFVTMMDEMKTLLKYAFNTENELTMRSQRPILQAWRPVSSIWSNRVTRSSSVRTACSAVA